MASFQERVVGALRLRRSTFEDVEHDASATSQAAGVVLLGSVSSSAALIALGDSVFGAGMMVVMDVVAWAVAAAVIWILGTRLLPGKNTEADYGQLLRTIGFARAPGIFGLFVAIPRWGVLLAVALWLWVLIATVIGVRQALDYEDTFRPAMVCGLAILGWMAVSTIVSWAGGTGLTGSAF